MNNTISFIHFRKIAEIGNDEGMNSCVFLARDEQLGDEIVIKQMEKSKFQQNEYFLESNIMYASKHPNIVEIQYASQDKDFIYLAMPYYKLGSLNSLLEKKYLSVREIIKFSLDFISGVSFIHSKGLLHLDIKPTNILLDNASKALLTDFGLSKYTDNNGIADQQYNYNKHADPEWFKNSARTIQSDIYQIGLTIYRMCNGVDILDKQIIEKNIDNIDALSDAVTAGVFPDRRKFLPHIPNNLQRIVLKALNVDPNQRYKNTIEIMNDLSAINCNLDWIYTGDPYMPYYKHFENYCYNIEISSCGNNITCLKTNKSTNRTVKVKKYCLKCNSRNGDIEKHLSKIVCGIG